MPFEKVASEFNASADKLSWVERISYFANFKKVLFSTSFSLEDQIITGLIATNKLPVEIFTIDTGRLFDEVHKVHQQTTDRYGIKINTYYPDAEKLQEFVGANGINGFYNSTDARHGCCGIRKVEPLNRALKDAEIWISGLRRDHSETRNSLPFAEVDSARRLLKVYPLLDSTTDEVWKHLKENNIPYNTMYENGYPSIGCAPCTRAVESGEEPRAGRWWWEHDNKRECGLHYVNGKLVPSSEASNA